jgi:uncharacterized membrane protein YhaH (DUF805 family)
MLGIGIISFVINNLLFHMPIASMKNNPDWDNAEQTIRQQCTEELKRIAYFFKEIPSNNQIEECVDAKLLGHILKSKPILSFVVLITLGLLSVVDCIIQIKRLHDRDRSGWWVCVVIVSCFLALSYPPLMIVVAIGGLWILIEMFCLRGTSGTNDYGPNPLA